VVLEKSFGIGSLRTWARTPRMELHEKSASLRMPSLLENEDKRGSHLYEVEGVWDRRELKKPPRESVKNHNN